MVRSARAISRFEHDFLLVARLFQHGVQRQDQRQVGCADKFQDVRARSAAEDSIFMLKPDGFRAAGLDPLGRLAIGIERFRRRW